MSCLVAGVEGRGEEGEVLHIPVYKMGIFLFFLEMLYALSVICIIHFLVLLWLVPKYPNISASSDFKS